MKTIIGFICVFLSSLLILSFFNIESLNDDSIQFDYLGNETTILEVFIPPTGLRIEFSDTVPDEVNFDVDPFNFISFQVNEKTEQWLSISSSIFNKAFSFEFNDNDLIIKKLMSINSIISSMYITDNIEYISAVKDDIAYFKITIEAEESNLTLLVKEFSNSVIDLDGSHVFGGVL